LKKDWAQIPIAGIEIRTRHGRVWCPRATTSPWRHDMPNVVDNHVKLFSLWLST